MKVFSTIVGINFRKYNCSEEEQKYERKYRRKYLQFVVDD